MTNALTIDIEDYFQVQAFSHVVRYEDWDKYESRVERNTHRLLEILSGQGRTLYGEHRTVNPGKVTATFFCLGWIAERYPGLIKEIQAQGHEIACHGYAHRLIYQQTREEFKEDLHRAKAILEEIIGRKVIGYRAPSYSITNQSLWAFEVLVEEGFKYDSSIFPIRHDFYGMPEAPRFPFLVSLNGTGTPEFKQLSFCNIDQKTPNFELRTSNYIIEFPLTTSPFGRFNLPIAGGGYFRLFPYFLVSQRLKRINQVESQPFVFYLHPWEVDPDQPKFKKAGLKSRFRHYHNLTQTEGRLKRLLKDFNFSPLKDLLPISAAISAPRGQGATRDV